ncbi:hypothetical protein BS47DRAFT_1361068 [Hydnum rufescens UP504]|uniref:Uncharacterized protein n=1 Tax=Hydnum rufescens UP504 TaxID=1448309 RepID=A0A9P6DXY1_9AGAM|nr:hypothetical protein BS47DRAFT_1361068 [Hydnum rufescens UP504]
MPVSRFLEPLISAVFLTSVTLHLIYNRRAFSDERSRLVAQTTILHDLAQRLRGGERIPDDEYDRLIALARRGRQDVGHPRIYEPNPTETRWRDTILGRKPAPSMLHNGGSDESNISEEWNAAVQTEASSSSTSRTSSPTTPSTPVAPSPVNSASKQPDPTSRASAKIPPGQRQHSEYL